MEMTLPTRSLHPPPPQPRSFANIFSSLLHLLTRRQTDRGHFRTFFPAHTLAPSASNILTPWHMGPFLYPSYYLKDALTSPGDPIPPALRAEIRGSLLAMEAEAEHLRREIECNFWRAYFRTGKQREEKDSVRQRDECHERWLRLLQGWERACRIYYVPVNEPAEVNVTVLMAGLGLE